VLTGITCSDCGAALADDPPGAPRTPCPECGSTARTFHDAETAVVTMTGWIDWVHEHTSWERRPMLLAFSLVLSVASVFVGYVIAGWIGGVVGLAVTLAGYVLGLRAVTRVREIERGTTRPSD